MIRVNIADAKADLSRYLGRVEQGETIVLCRRNVPVAEIRPLPKRRGGLHPVGIDRGMDVPPSFFEPLPDDMLAPLSPGAGPRGSEPGTDAALRSAGGEHQGDVFPGVA